MSVYVADTIMDERDITFVRRRAPARQCRGGPQEETPRPGRMRPQNEVWLLVYLVFRPQCIANDRALADALQPMIQVGYTSQRWSILDLQTYCGLASVSHV